MVVRYDSDSMPMSLHFKRWAPLLGLILFAAALFALHHALAGHRYLDVVAEIESISAPALLVAALCTVGSYAVLTGYDFLSLRYLGRSLPPLRVALASFTSYALSNNIGFAALAGGSVRLRLYSAWGLSTIEVAKLVGFAALTFWVGFFAAEGVALAFAPLPASMPVQGDWARMAGGLMLAMVAAYLLATVLRRRPLVFRGFALDIPRPRIALAQVLVSTADWALASAALYVLMPPELRLTYPDFVAIFLLAQVAGLISHVPGGLGVFESVMLLLLGEPAAAPAVAAALAAFRVIYYLLPLSAAASILAVYELLERRAHVVRFGRALGTWATGALPWIMAVSAFASGAVLLLSGVTPAEAARVAWLRQVLPLPVVEISHLLGSLAGAGLLILAWGLRRRLDAAYQLVLALLAFGAALSILKGLDYEEATFLMVAFAVLLPCRRHFYRKAALASDAFSPGWVAAIVLVVAGSVWLALFAHKHVEYTNELWWQFAFRGDAPRALRASVAVVAFFVLLAVYRLLRPAAPEPAPPTADDLTAAKRIIGASRESDANLALLGDKRLLFSAAGAAFIMYGVERRSWVALGDPVGAELEIAELAWSYRELCDRHDGWPVFYQVSAHHLPLYLDLGLSLLKLGEEARVPLAGFGLEGSGRRTLRQGVHKLEREGYAFQWVEPAEVPALMPQLREISDSWLKSKSAAEKRFSLGCFDERYLANFALGLVRSHDRIVAFSDIWLSADFEEISPDLMRFRPDVANATMDYLFVNLMLAGKARGYRWFNLGMAPLSGLPDRALAPAWAKLGAFVFRHGEHFYNFQGLRQYKDKFDPQWRPKYLASPGGLALPIIMANIATLISGSLKGVFAR
jgi:phosphatidylglycerol lysyltransferase